LRSCLGELVEALLRLFDAAAGDLADWSEFDAEAERWDIDVRGQSREELTALIEGSTREIPITEHLRLHQEASDFVRWGRRGGRKYPSCLRSVELLAARQLPIGARQLETLTRHRAGSSTSFSPTFIEV
jgi:hypothetical protein